MKLVDRSICSGCGACHDACVRDAIAMVADCEGFLYPKIDLKKCIGCGGCVRVCPAIHRDVSRRPISVCAARAKDDGLRLDSSSGGVFSLLARYVLSEGGRVYGAAFDQRDWSVYHVGVESEAGLGDLRGSKYLQSRAAGIYRKVKEDLGRGLFVLFTGTPCQIAALRHYLGRDWDRLLMVDVVCHGVPSPLVWKNYLIFQSPALAGGRGSASDEGWGIKRIRFRRKDCGWKRYSLSLRFANDKEYRAPFSEDPFMRAFLAELCNRPSCHHCQFRELRSGADLTIGDFWGVDKFHPEVDDDRGTSLVLLNTSKGASFFERIRPELDCGLATVEEAVCGNSALVSSHCPHRNRGRFLRDCNSKEFESLVTRMLMPTLLSRGRMFVGRILRKMGLRK